MTAIERWTDPAQVPEITRLLHAAYAPLAEAGMRYLASHQDDAITLHRLSTGESFLALDDGKVVGTVSLTQPGPFQDCELFARPGVYAFHQFAVLPDRQGTGIGKALLGHIETRARDSGATHLACDTAEAAKHLIAMYEKHGFEHAGHADWESTNYRSVLLMKPLFQALPG